MRRVEGLETVRVHQFGSNACKPSMSGQLEPAVIERVLMQGLASGGRQLGREHAQTFSRLPDGLPDGWSSSPTAARGCTWRGEALRRAMNRDCFSKTEAALRSGGELAAS